MAKKQNKGNDDEVLRGGPPAGPPKGAANPEYWENDFDNMPWYNKVEKIMELPGTDNIAGVMARAVFKDDRQRKAVVRLAYRHIKFKDNNHQEKLRILLASSIGDGGVGRLDMLFAATNLIAPAMYREARGLSKKKDNQEEVYRGGRGSDFREKVDGQGQGGD